LLVYRYCVIWLYVWFVAHTMVLKDPHYMFQDHHHYGCLIVVVMAAVIELFIASSFLFTSFVCSLWRWHNRNTVWDFYSLAHLFECITLIIVCHSVWHLSWSSPLLSQFAVILFSLSISLCHIISLQHRHIIMRWSHYAIGFLLICDCLSFLSVWFVSLLCLIGWFIVYHSNCHCLSICWLPREKQCETNCEYYCWIFYEVITYLDYL